MASFLAGLAAAARTVKPLPDTLSEPVGARALQAKLATELGGVESPPDTDLLALYREYRQARKDMHKVFAERVESSAEADAVIAHRDALVREIAKMPATTLRGFGAKMDVLGSCGCAALESVCPTNSGEMLLQSVAADGYRLFGASDAPLSAEEKDLAPARLEASA